MDFWDEDMAKELCWCECCCRGDMVGWWLVGVGRDIYIDGELDYDYGGRVCDSAVA